MNATATRRSTAPMSFRSSTIDRSLPPPAQSAATPTSSSCAIVCWPPRVNPATSSRPAEVAVEHRIRTDSDDCIEHRGNPRRGVERARSRRRRQAGQSVPRSRLLPRRRAVGKRHAEDRLAAAAHPPQRSRRRADRPHAAVPEVALAGRVHLRPRLGAGLRAIRRRLLSEAPLGHPVHAGDRAQALGAVRRPRGGARPPPHRPRRSPSASTRRRSTPTS